MRAAVFGDIYHMPEWRLCVIQSCREVLRTERWPMCERHANMPWMTPWGLVEPTRSFPEWLYDDGAYGPSKVP